MFKTLFNKLLNYDKDSSLIRDNMVLFISSVILNGIGFLYHFYMGRVLGPTSYGVLGTLLSMVYLMIVPLFTVQTSVTKFVSVLRAKKEYGKIKYLLLDSLKVFSVVGILGFLILVLFTPKIGGFLRIPIVPLLILDAILIFALLLPVMRGILQGTQLFKSLGKNQVIEGVSKLGLGILLVFIGLDVVGAISGVMLSYAFAFAFAFIPLRFVFKYKKEKFKTKKIYLYSLPVLIVLLSLTAFYSLDLIIVKHFFEDLQAGYYAAVSLIGRTVYFATLSITFVMFPKVSELHFNNKESKHILFKSLIFVLLIGIPLILFYLIFPTFTIKLFFGSEYLVVKDLLWLFAAVMFFFSLVYTLAFYNLSRNKINFIYLLLFFNILEVALLYLFHNSIGQIIYLLLALMVVLFFSMLVYTLFGKNVKTVDNNTSL